MKANWLRISDLGFKYEGGFVNNPKDPGGATNLGVTIKTLSAYRGRPCSIADVRSLQKPEAREIYRAQYWNVIRGDELPDGVDEAVYDYTINSGPVQAVKDLQRVLGVRVDGHMGAATLDALKNADATDVIDRYCDQRLRFMKSLRTFRTFGKGWTARVNSVRRVATGMATGVFVTNFMVLGDELDGNAKADPRDQAVLAKTMAGIGQITAAAGFTATGAADQVKSASDQLSAYQDVLPIIKYVTIGLMVVGIGLTIYALFKKSKEA